MLSRGPTESILDFNQLAENNHSDRVGCGLSPEKGSGSPITPENDESIRNTRFAYRVKQRIKTDEFTNDDSDSSKVCFNSLEMNSKSKMTPAEG